MIHLPKNSGYPYSTEAQKTDMALLELEESVNTCVEDDRDCWHISPVRLHDTPGSIEPLEEVRTLGNNKGLLINFLTSFEDGSIYNKEVLVLLLIFIVSKMSAMYLLL
jgi:hypothetical protein